MTVSVTIPTYNRADLLPHALQSALDQTHRDIEVIVIDDGSTDGTRDVVSRYGDRVRYFPQANGGLGVARNAGLAKATGEFVAFLDSDDYWQDFKLELQVALLKALPDVAFLFSEFVILKDDGRKIHNGSRTWLSRPTRWSELYQKKYTASQLGVRVAGAPSDFDIYTGGLYKSLLNEALVLPTTAIVRREAIGSLRFTEGMTIFEDWEFFARLARDHEGAFIDVETAINRGHDSAERLTRCSQLAKTQCYLAMLDRVWKDDPGFLEAHGDQLRRSESGAALAVAREALLQGRGDVLDTALRRWQSVPSQQDRYRAVLYRLLSAVPGGRQIMFGSARCRSLLKSLAPAHASHPVNPST